MTDFSSLFSPSVLVLRWFLLVLFIVSCFGLPFPSLPEQFVVDVNMTGAGGEWLGLETIAFDLLAGRNHIQVSGPSFGPPWGQLTLSPISPNRSWFVQYEIKPWTCFNQTVNMQWSPFW
jgi:hypothetical protein